MTNQTLNNQTTADHLDARKLAHLNNSTLPVHTFKIVAYTDDYNQAMGLERLLYDAYPNAAAANGGYNKVVPVGTSHPFYNFFRENGVRIMEALQ